MSVFIGGGTPPDGTTITTNINGQLSIADDGVTPVKQGAGVVSGSASLGSPDALAVVSSLVYFVNAAAAGRRTTDGGATWTNVTLTSLTGGTSRVAQCKTDPNRLIAYQGNGAATELSTDGGASFTSGTALAGGALFSQISFPTATIAAAAVNTIGTRRLHYSTNGGSTFTICATGPTVNCWSIDMFDGSFGFAVDASGNLWRTTDGGINWTDTTANVTTNPTALTSGTLVATSSTTCLYADRTTGRIEYYNGTTMVSVCLVRQDSSGTHITNFVSVGTGEYYIHLDGFLCRTNDAGINWTVRHFQPSPFLTSTIDTLAFNTSLGLVRLGGTSGRPMIFEYGVVS